MLQLQIVRAVCLCLLVLVSAQALAQTSREEASRILAQGSFGPTLAEIDRVAAIGETAWVDEQLARRASFQQPLWAARDPSTRGHGEMQGIWFERAVQAPDQLRQRVAFALSQILVVSAESDIPSDGLVTYYDILVRHAFGNYRSLLGATTRSMAMGRYLSMYQNRAPDPAAGIRADENFAREIMQLFTIGLVRLNPDGTPALDAAGRTTPTYNQTTVENLARVFTGWSSSGNSGFYDWPAVWTAPMVPYEEFHDAGEKRLLGKVFPAGRSAAVELERVLDLLFNHPNTGPFVSRQLIQRLVTSNPSPAYVGRVAAVFGNNGAGVRGDLKAVVRAILLDPEARRGHIDMPERFGKVREPLLRLTHVLRAFSAVSTAADGHFPPQWIQWAIPQAPLSSPTVFNYYRPSYAPDGELRALGLVAPEMQLADDSTINQGANFTAGLIWQHSANPGATGDPDNPQIVIDIRREAEMARNPAALVEHLNLLLASGQLPPALREAVRRRLLDFRYDWDENAGYSRAWAAIYLIVNSPQYMVQK